MRARRSFSAWPETFRPAHALPVRQPFAAARRDGGPAILAGHFDKGFGSFAVAYLLAPLLGGLVAAVGYKLLVLDPQHELGERPIGKLAEDSLR